MSQLNHPQRSSRSRGPEFSGWGVKTVRSKTVGMLLGFPGDEKLGIAGGLVLFLCFFFSDVFFAYFLEMFLPSLHVPPTTSI